MLISLVVLDGGPYLADRDLSQFSFTPRIYILLVGNTESIAYGTEKEPEENGLIQNGTPQLFTQKKYPSSVLRAD